MTSLFMNFSNPVLVNKMRKLYLEAAKIRPSAFPNIFLKGGDKMPKLRLTDKTFDELKELAPYLSNIKNCVKKIITVKLIKIIYYHYLVTAVQR